MGALKTTFITVSGWCNDVWALSGSLLHFVVFFLSDGIILDMAAFVTSLHTTFG